MFFFFNDTATTEIYTLSLHDALPIYGAANTSRRVRLEVRGFRRPPRLCAFSMGGAGHSEIPGVHRSEEHTSELQSHSDLVCRLLLEKKKINHNPHQRAQASVVHSMM